MLLRLSLVFSLTQGPRIRPESISRAHEHLRRQVQWRSHFAEGLQCLRIEVARQTQITDQDMIVVS